MSVLSDSKVSLTHVPVRARDVPAALIGNRDGIYVDATFGRGGHTRLLLNALSPQARLFAFDRDKEAVAFAKNVVDPRFTMIASPCSRMKEVLSSYGIEKVDGILMDLGISSPQIDDPSRGFSFRADGPLDMRMDQGTGPTASEWLMASDESRIQTVLREYGEERYAKAIAKAILKAQEAGPIRTTGALARLVEKTIPRSLRDGAQHPATRTFQAIRIAVNDEFGELRCALNAAGSLLNPNGRLVVIAFHSLEDRIVKRFFASGLHPQVDSRLVLPECDLPRPLWRTCKRIWPGREEIQENIRSRSAVLRMGTRTDEPWREGESYAL